MNLFKLTLALGISALCGTSASFGAVVYSQLGTTALTTSTTTLPIVLEDINFPATTTGRQELSALTFGYGVLPGTVAQTGAVLVNFYDTFNPASTGVVESSYLGGFGGTITIGANTGTTTAFRSSSFSGLTTLTTPIFFTDNNLAIILTFTDSTGANYSTVLTPLTSSNTATIGSSTAGVYRDTNGDGDFQANELSTTLGNEYLSITTVPEPGTWAMIALAGVGLVVWRKRAILA